MQTQTYSHTQDMSALTTQNWDAIVIGTGIGGGTVGYELVKKGWKVLLLEKGGHIHCDNTELQGETPEERLKQGWWPQPVSYLTDTKKIRQFYAFIGCGVGGSALHYAAALERFHPKDFEAYHAESIHIDAWPVSYESFEPYYKLAEAVYNVKQEDPNWDQRISVWDREFADHLTTSGLKPTRLNVAINYVPGCDECIGKTCDRKCKQDARRACLEKALQFPNCAILHDCEVTRLVANSSHIEFVECTIGNQTICLQARYIVLAAGALHTPQLLLKSANSHWPSGLANDSGMVGKNLMFHGLEMFAIWAPKKYNRSGLQKKSLAIKDFYYDGNTPLGFIQSMGLGAGRGMIALYLKQQLGKWGIKHKRLQSLLTKIPAYVASKLFGEASIFCSQIEDFPSLENRVVLSTEEPDGAYFIYTVTPDLQARAKQLYQLFSTCLGKWRIVKLSPSVDFNTGHACGTCKFGTDPNTSVLNPDCRSHQIENLYVADTSFMPRSGATNPSLTTAANAIRVAEKIHSAMQASQ